MSMQAVALATPPLPARRATLAERLTGARRFVEQAIDHALPRPSSAPRRLHRAMRHAVMPGGKRARPLLVVLVAEACAPDRARDDLVARMAAAVELIHCASLAHDDLPAFDDAPTRRGRPSCHAAHGEPAAILAGDALLTLAFELLAGTDRRPDDALRLTRVLAGATGSRHGIIGGQALETEPHALVHDVHARKTAALFRAAAEGGAIAAGHARAAPRWARFGEIVGLALQLRDDLDDCTARPEEIGKPVGRDAALGRPNAVRATSAREVEDAIHALCDEAITILEPSAEATATLRTLVDQQRPAAKA